MFNSFPFNIINTSPLVSADNITSLNYLMDTLPSPYFCNELTNFDYLVSNHDSSPINEDLIANHNSDFTNSILTDDSSIVEVDNKVDSSKGSDEVNGIIEEAEMMNHMISSSTTNKKKKKRSSNKDRHSKIRTAQGLRDRRMRLSLPVARPFFQLQDILGFDKASKTVEWLLIQSSTAIEELLQSNHGSPSGVANNYSMSSSTCDDCEVQSMVLEIRKESSKLNKRSLLVSVKKDEPKHKRKRTTKEERKKARDKARTRTLEKLQRREVEKGANETNCLGIQIPLSSLTYQSAPSCTISTLPNMFGGPQ